MRDEEQTMKNKIGRRKYFVFSALAVFGFGFLRKFYKNPKIGFRGLRVSLRRAQYYKKLYDE